MLHNTSCQTQVQSTTEGGVNKSKTTFFGTTNFTQKTKFYKCIARRCKGDVRIAALNRGMLSFLKKWLCKRTIQEQKNLKMV